MSIIPIRRSGRGPVQRHAVYIDVDRIFAEFGLTGLYEEAFQHLEAQQRAGFDLAATSEERDRITVIEANIPETETLDAAALHLVREATDIPTDTVARMRAAINADQQAGRWPSDSAWCSEAIASAVDAARTKNDGSLPTPPPRLPNRLVR